MQKIDVIIPTYKPDKKLFHLLDMLDAQTVSINKIILMNTEESYLNQLTYGSPFLKKYHKVSVYHISKLEFNHGKTRNRGVKHSNANIFIMMTQDAIPADEYLVENLVNALKQPNVAAAYARQIPHENSGEIEKFTRTFNYPPQSSIKSKKDLEHLGIKTYFCSNVCAAYNRKIFQELGGFIKYTIFNEDMIYAAKAIKSGYSIAYEAEAKVFHSHHYSNKEQFQRNFDLGVSQADHPEIFQEFPSENEGMHLVNLTVKHLKQIGQKKQIFPLYTSSAYKYLGYKLGKNYHKLSKRTILKCSMNKEYWRQYQMRKEVSQINASYGHGRNTEKEGV